MSSSHWVIQGKAEIKIERTRGQINSEDKESGRELRVENGTFKCEIECFVDVAR